MIIAISLKLLVPVAIKSQASFTLSKVLGSLTAYPACISYPIGAFFESNPDLKRARNPFFVLSDLISLSSCANPARIVSTSFSVGLSPVGSLIEMIMTPFSANFLRMAK
ncbi:MAG TPA: hypothetical protein VMR41_04815 [Patescibacteria group bacterium]|nr:hypothetical protein [Patescibacteria group bacterium]